MAYSLATRLKRAVKNAGIKYKEVSGWESRGHGTMGTIESVMCHHTAGAKNGDHPSLNVVTHGHSGLRGPLAHFVLSRDGTVFLVAAGICYHAGKVGSSIYQNSHSVGIEAEATGTSSWPSAQVDAYAKLCKALCKEFGLSTSRVVGHKEAATPRGRKIDPNFSMDDFRKKVGGAKGGVSQSGGSTGGSSKKYKTVSYGTTLGLYDKGTPVKEWQSKALGYSTKEADGFFGPSTEKDTKVWQRKNGLTADGLVGEKTWAKYKGTGKTSTSKPKPKPAAKNLSVDGILGKSTAKEIQERLGVKVDGVLGKDSLKAWQKYDKMKFTDGVWSNQNAYARKHCPNVLSSVMPNGSGGSNHIDKIQKTVGAKVDGVIGPDTIKKLQKHLNNNSKFLKK